MSELTVEQMDLLRGTLLGDGCLKKVRNNVYLQLSHSKAQKAYLMHKVKVLEGILCSRLMEYNKTMNGKVFTQFTILFRKAQEFYTLRDRFYPEGKKRVTPELLRGISDQAFAYWFADDGSSVRTDRVGFNTSLRAVLVIGVTYCSLEDAKEIAKILSDRFGQCSLGLSRKSAYQFWFGVDATQKIAEIVNPLLEECIPSKVIRPRKTKRKPYAFAQKVRLG
jgi:hypothetical protein